MQMGGDVMVLDQGPNSKLSGSGGARDPALANPGASQAHVDGGARPGASHCRSPNHPAFYEVPNKSET